MSTRRPSPSPSHSPSRSFSPHPPTIRTPHPRLLQRHTHRRTLCTRQAARIEAEVDRDSRMCSGGSSPVRSRREHRCPGARGEPASATASSAPAARGVAPRCSRRRPRRRDKTQHRPRQQEGPAEGGHFGRRDTARQPRRRRPRRARLNNNTKRTARTETVVPDSAAALVERRRPPLAESRHIRRVDQEARPGQPPSSFHAPANGAQEAVSDAELTRSTASNARCARGVQISRKDALSEMQGREVRAGDWRTSFLQQVSRGSIAALTNLRASILPLRRRR